MKAASATRLMVVPVDMSKSNIRGMGWSANTPEHRIWATMLPAESDPLAIARLLAGLMLADHEPILTPQDITPSAIPLELLADGSLRYSRGKRFTPWACTEIERIARRLVAEQADYLREVQLA